MWLDIKHAFYGTSRPFVRGSDKRAAKFAVARTAVFAENGLSPSPSDRNLDYNELPNARCKKHKHTTWVLAMNVKQLKALRKSQHEIMQPLRGRLDEDAWQRLNEYTSSLVQLVKDTNDTREERLLVENENLKRELAEQEKTYQEELARMRQTSAQELAGRLSGIEAKYQKKATQMEERTAKLEHINELARRRLLQLDEVACTTKALNAAKNRFGNGALLQLVRMAIDVIVMCIDKGKDGHWSWAEFDVVPYHTDKGWCVFVCGKGELSTMPTVLRVNEFAFKYSER